MQRLAKGVQLPESTLLELELSFLASGGIVVVPPELSLLESGRVVASLCWMVASRGIGSELASFGTGSSVAESVAFAFVGREPASGSIPSIGF